MGRGGLYIAFRHVLLSWEQHRDIHYNVMRLEYRAPTWNTYMFSELAICLAWSCFNVLIFLEKTKVCRYICYLYSNGHLHLGFQVSRDTSG